MLPKTSAIAVCGRCNASLADPSVVSSITSWTSSRPNRRTSVADPRRLLARRYATAYHPGAIPSQKNGKHAPPSWPKTKNPTPYEIFGLAKTAPYNKAYFYELVKIYHPDRLQHHANDGIPHPTKLERYRLIVAANDLLCDPAKRRLYDMQGIGWLFDDDIRQRYRAMDRKWREQPGNASQNATWEDWERWYQERDGTRPPEPVYMSNGGFAFVVGIFVVIGAWGQASRADKFSRTLVEMREEMSQGVDAGMRKRELESGTLTREARVDSFLKQREGWQVDPPCGPPHEKAAAVAK